MKILLCLSVYEKSTLSMKCPVYEMSFYEMTLHLSIQPVINPSCLTHSYSSMGFLLLSIAEERTRRRGC